MEELYNKLSEKFPFLTLVEYIDEQHIGIIQNMNNTIVSMYVLDDITDEDMKKKFLELGEIWWWESNRQIPINIFLKNEFDQFKPYLKTFSRKEFKILQGPSVSLNDIMNKRVKKKQISLRNNSENN